MGKIYETMNHWPSGAEWELRDTWAQPYFCSTLRKFNHSPQMVEPRLSWVKLGSRAESSGKPTFLEFKGQNTKENKYAKRKQKRSPGSSPWECYPELICSAPSFKVTTGGWEESAHRIKRNNACSERAGGTACFSSLSQTEKPHISQGTGQNTQKHFALVVGNNQPWTEQCYSSV